MAGAILLASALCLNAETWRCAYKIGAGEGIDVESRFDTRGTALDETGIEPKDMDLRARYVLLQNDREAIVAAASNHDLDPYPERATVGVVTIVIAKGSGVMQWFGALFEREPVLRRGQCHRSPW